MLGSLVARLVAVGSLETGVESHVVIKPGVCHHLVEQLHPLQEHCTGESKSKNKAEEHTNVVTRYGSRVILRITICA